MTSYCFMLIEGCLMLSLACVAADMANLNSFSLLPLGLAWMTSLHFSLYGSLKSVMEEKHTQFKHRDFRWQLHQLNEHLINWSYGKKRGIDCSVLKLKLVASLTVQRSQCHCIHFISCINLWDFLQDVHRADEPILFSKPPASQTNISICTGPCR